MNFPEIPRHPAYPKCPVRRKILTGPGRSRRRGVEVSCLKKKDAGERVKTKCNTMEMHVGYQYPMIPCRDWNPDLQHFHAPQRPAGSWRLRNWTGLDTRTDIGGAAGNSRVRTREVGCFKGPKNAVKILSRSLWASRIPSLETKTSREELARRSRTLEN